MCLGARCQVPKWHRPVSSVRYGRVAVNSRQQAGPAARTRSRKQGHRALMCACAGEVAPRAPSAPRVGGRPAVTVARSSADASGGGRGAAAPDAPFHLTSSMASAPAIASRRVSVSSSATATSDLSAAAAHAQQPTGHSRSTPPAINPEFAALIRSFAPLEAAQLVAKEQQQRGRSRERSRLDAHELQDESDADVPEAPAARSSAATQMPPQLGGHYAVERARTLMRTSDSAVQGAGHHQLQPQRRSSQSPNQMAAPAKGASVKRDHTVRHARVGDGGGGGGRAGTWLPGREFQQVNAMGRAAVGGRASPWQPGCQRYHTPCEHAWVRLCCTWMKAGTGFAYVLACVRVRARMCVCVRGGWGGGCQRMQRTTLACLVPGCGPGEGILSGPWYRGGGA